INNQLRGAATDAILGDGVVSSLYVRIPPVGLCPLPGTGAGPKLITSCAALLPTPFWVMV
ncbi:hypothetical protein VS877_22555, partial [Salmonella enterica subsp. enterica serovar Paratyphi A]|nr:hypothetical protein [Salmonella enterica subsp. enterica serovar Paratyphi A]